MFVVADNPRAMPMSALGTVAGAVRGGGLGTWWWRGYGWRGNPPAVPCAAAMG